MDRYRLMNYEGTLFWKDIPIADFKIENGVGSYLRLYEGNKKYYPLEFWTAKPTFRDLQMMIADRMLPPTRQGLDGLLKRIGLAEYSYDGLIRINHGLCTDDYYWFRQSHETIEYKDIQIRDRYKTNEQSL